MATIRRYLLSNLSTKLNSCRSVSTKANSYGRLSSKIIGGTFLGIGIGTYVLLKVRKPVFSPALAKDEESGGAKRAAMQTARELRFLSFASVEYEGNVFMTPQDFLESVTDEAPRARTGRLRLTQDEVHRYLSNTPSRWKGSQRFLRSVNDKGLISYTEYLFLLCVLTKPHSGFRIAFNMFDTDGNQRVDKKEFLVLMDCVQSAFGSKTIQNTENIAYQTSRRANIWDVLQDLSDENKRKSPVDTTLTVHFFGKKGKDVLKYEDFHRFMDNLQTEVLELEFSEFSRGMDSITEEEFAKVLLRYTILTSDETKEYLDRMKTRVPHVKGVSFQDFKDFSQFLNNLDDFAIAMRLFTFNGNAINEEQFKRAVKAVTGFNLNPHLVHVVFQLFDSDGDGHLSHKEFISVMKDRLHRGFRSQGLYTQSRWDSYKSCIKHEMKQS